MPTYPILSQRVATVITTTIFTGPTAAPVVSSGSAKIPIGAIVGGLFGGILLAFAVIGGWFWWGRAIKRKAQKQPRLRPALKRDPYRESRATSTPNSGSVRDGSRKSRSHPAAASQKSVTFAEEPTEAETWHKPSTDTPPPPSISGSTGSPDDKERRSSDDRERGRAAANVPTPPPPPPSVRSGKIRTAPSLPRTPSAERAYAPARPSPLAKEAVSRAPSQQGASTSKLLAPARPGFSTNTAGKTSTPPAPVPAPAPVRLPSTQNTNSSQASSTPRDMQSPPPPDSGPSTSTVTVRRPPPDIPTASTSAVPRLASMSTSTALVPPTRTFRQVSYISTDVSAPSMYSQEGTASDVGPARMGGSRSGSGVGYSDVGTSVATTTSMQGGDSRR